MPITNILVFDSGVGGLSIVGEIQQQIPQASICFASDNEGFPYGTKSEGELINRVHLVMQNLVEHSQPDVIVIGCNSASTLALPHLRTHFAKPIVGVVPAIKPAAQISKTKTIGLLATPATIKREYTDNLIQAFAADCNVIRVGSTELVQLAEQKLRGDSINLALLKEIVEPLQDTKLDTVVLGCTHFPHLKAELASLLPNHVQWIDSSYAIAQQTKRLLEKHDAHLQQPTQHYAVFTQQTDEIEKLQPNLANFNILQYQYLQID